VVFLQGQTNEWEYRHEDSRFKDQFFRV